MNVEEFVMIASLHLLAVVSPGPDFAVVFRQALSKGRVSALWTSFGVGCGIFVHVAYSLLGLGLLIAQSEYVFSFVKFLGSAYLVWIGVKSFCAKNVAGADRSDAVIDSPVAAAESFRLGFLTNALNPKATLFFLAIFSAIISRDTSQMAKFFYGLWMVFATTVWFSFLSFLLSKESFRARILSFGTWVEKVTGLALILFGVKLALSSPSSR